MCQCVPQGSGEGGKKEGSPTPGDPPTVEGETRVPPGRRGGAGEGGIPKPRGSPPRPGWRGGGGPAGAHKGRGAGGGGGGAMRGGGRRAAANARERHRTHSVNAAFGALRRLIPTRPADRRLSKVETLRLASSYISHLANVLRALRRGEPRPCPPPGGSAPRAVCTFCLGLRRRRHREGEKPLSSLALSGH
ncbi:basic helix-loop-helix transcription factor scleraxis-like [Phaenicophaeus curvirostris]|uniref:basic helix-loop-helix transcription factor scleraxis-like n=1 Tax=Phaenicophaeus curvirostris TaxID=33595 RepID=UPI0037F0E3AA